MMQSVQNNFGYVVSVYGPPSQSVSFPAPNAAGNGLIVVAYFRIVWPTTSPNLAVSDSNGNSYLPIGACSVYSSNSGWRSYLAAWYVESCKAGANTVTVTESVDTTSITYILGVSVFEYAGGFGPLDVSALGVTATQSTISLTFSLSGASDLVFCYGASEGVRPTIAIDPSIRGFTTEQTEQIDNSLEPPYRIVELLAAQKVYYSPGVQTVTLDFSSSYIGGNSMLVAALPLNSPPPAPPAPPPVPGTPTGWPTIF